MAPISNVYSSSSLLLPEEEEKEEPATIMTRKYPPRDHKEQYYHHHHPPDMMTTMVTPENDTLELHYNTAFQFNPSPIQNTNEEVVHPRTRPSYQDREQHASKTKKTTQTETTRVASDTDNDNDTTLKLMPPKQQRNSVRTSPLLSPSTSHTAPTTAAAATTMLHSPSSVATMRTSNHHNSFNFNTPTSQGQKFSGTPDILISSHVREGPGRIMNAPVPSVFNDERGSIHRLRVGGKRINVSHSEMGMMRSGHLYPIATHVFVLSGTVEVWLLQPKAGTQKVLYSTGASFAIPPYTPHILNFVTHCILNEWWEKHGDAQCWIFQPYRNIVDIQNAMVSNRSTGNHQLLIPQNDYEQRQLSSSSLSASSFSRGRSGAFSSFVTAFCYTSLGLTAGTILGIALSLSSPHYYGNTKQR